MYDWRLNYFDDTDIMTINDYNSHNNKVMVHGIDGHTVDDDTLERVFISVIIPSYGRACSPIGLTVMPYIVNSYTVIDYGLYSSRDGSITNYVVVDPHGDTIREIAGDIYRMLID